MLSRTLSLIIVLALVIWIVRNPATAGHDVGHLFARLAQFVGSL